MKNQWVLYLVVAIISIGAGVAIAGTPNSSGTPPTISVVPTTVAPAPTTTEPPPVTSPPTTTEAPVEEPVETSTTQATTTTTEPVPERADIAVVAVNGAGTQGLATQIRDELLFIGFSQARATDGTTIVDETTVYYFEGFELAAAAVAEYFEITPDQLRPISEAPDFATLDGDQVAVYIGRDRS